MSFLRASARFLLRSALCFGAVAAGVAAARYSDIARDEIVEIGPARANASAPSSLIVKKSGAESGAPEVDVGLAPFVLHGNAHDPTATVSETMPVPISDAVASALHDGRIMTGATPHRLVLFTFDDGPSRFTTPLLLDRLDAAGVRAVFFITASNMRGDNLAQRRQQKIARESVARGHVLASHGTFHMQLPLLSDKRALSEVMQAEAIFERVLGVRPWLIRPPGGAHSERIDRLLAERGYTTVLWNLGAGDFQVRSAEDVHETWRAVLERREAQGERGGIILLHDTYAWSVDAFQLIVDDLLARNCSLLGDPDAELYDFADDPALFFEAREGAGPSEIVKPVVLDEDTLAWRQARVRADTEQRCAKSAAR